MDLHHFLIILIFIVGYLMIIFEHTTGINKATSALLMAVGCWAVQFTDPIDIDRNIGHLNGHLANVSQVILFLLGALAIVEIIHAHGGLNMITKLMRIRSKARSLWVMSFIAFFLSGILDNLTTTIVMIMILKRLVVDTEDRLIFGAAAVIAANAGGAWTPIGDVTTTMLWVGGQVTCLPLIRQLFMPSVVCLMGALACLSWRLKGKLEMLPEDSLQTYQPKARTVFILGLSSLIFVPVFNVVTGLPPFMGILFSLSFMWFVTDLLHRKHTERQHLRVASLLPRLDLSGILFFLGILLSVDALETAGLLQKLAFQLDQAIVSRELITVFIGIFSAIIDNVPLVAGCMGMYDMSLYPPDSLFWHLIAFTAGTGGSMLIIGSAAGVAFMGLEKVDFFWYLRRATVPAAVGYFIGIGTLLFFT